MTFILRSSPCVLAFLPINLGNSLDKPTDKTYLNVPNSTTSIERFTNIFYRDEHGSISPELQYCIHLSTMGLIVGGLFGGTVRGKGAFIKFIDNNEATMFRNHLDAKRKLQDVVTFNIAKGAFQWGWRTAFFTSVYGVTSTIISVFRGKSGIIEHVDAGLLAGALYNMKNGIRGVIVGGGLGCALGTICGSLSYALLKVTGNTMEDVRFYTSEWKKNRVELLADGDRKHLLKKEEEELLNVVEKVIETDIRQ